MYHEHLHQSLRLTSSEPTHYLSNPFLFSGIGPLSLNFNPRLTCSRSEFPTVVRDLTADSLRLRSDVSVIKYDLPVQSNPQARDDHSTAFAPPSEPFIL